MASKTKGLELIAKTLIAGLFFVQVWLFKGFVVDDTFISFRFVQQFVQGHGLVYNLGERVEGYSNFLWLILLAPFAVSGQELTLVAKLLGITLGLGTVWVTWRLGRHLSKHEGFHLISPLLLAATGPFAAWSVGGLETPLFTLLLTLSVYRFIVEESSPTCDSPLIAENKLGDTLPSGTRSPIFWLFSRGQQGFKVPLSGLLFGLTSLARPEGVFFFGFVLIAAVFNHWRTGTLALRRDIFRLTGFGLIFVPYLTWRYAYYGLLLPNTVYAKSLGLHPRAFLEGAFYVYDFVTAIGGIFFLLLAGTLALFNRPQREAVIIIAGLLAGFVIFIFIGGGDWMPMHRFGVHVLPVLYLLVQLGLEQIYVRGGSGREAALLVAVLLVGQAGYLLATSVEQRFIENVGAGPMIHPDPPRVRYLVRHARPGDTLAVIDAGLIGYRLPLVVRIVDMVGLTDNHIAHRPVTLPGGLFGRGDAFGKWDTDYVLAQRPRMVQVNLVQQLSDGSWATNFTGTTLLVNDPRFRETYRPVEAPGVSGIFIRREDP
jgi:arabinofuranosyltransferase